jgi:hypothetical protein
MVQNMVYICKMKLYSSGVYFTYFIVLSYHSFDMKEQRLIK